MGRPSTRVLGLAAATSLFLAGVAFPQALQNQPSMNQVGRQMNAGANNVGNGAVQLGEGVRLGAIAVWEAVRDGAQTTASRLAGTAQPDRQPQ